MKRTTVALWALALALVASNGWWAYRAVDTAVTLDYQGVSLNEHHEALVQTLAILPIVAQCDSSAPQVVEAARLASNDDAPFEKDGFTWTGRLGLKFDGDGRLEKAVAGWEPF